MELKTNLDHLPRKNQRELTQAVKIIFEEFDKAINFSTADWKKKARIVKIILYGSHARGDFVHDPHQGRGHKGYVSDYDLLIIVNSAKLANFFDLWSDIDDRLMRRNLHQWERPAFNLIIHSSHDVNHQLSRGRYFFADIAKEGIALYETPRSKKLKDPKLMTPKIALEEAQVHFEEWFPDAQGFLKGAQFYLDEKNFKLAAFSLHQAAEHAYRAFLLVMTYYAPDIHDIKKLRSLSEDINHNLIPAWPRGFRRERRLFQLLRDAYVKARYSKHYKITQDELDWLSKCTAALHQLIARKCKTRITALKHKLKK